MTHSNKEGSEKPNRGRGRPPGTPNKTTATLKEAILLAAETVGKDGKGDRGLQGYLETLAMLDPKAFSALLGKVLPLQVVGSGPEGEHRHAVRVEFVAANPPA
jgi:hypothetical protein